RPRAQRLQRTRPICSKYQSARHLQSNRCTTSIRGAFASHRKEVRGEHSPQENDDAGPGKLPTSFRSCSRPKKTVRHCRTDAAGRVKFLAINVRINTTKNAERWNSSR